MDISALIQTAIKAELDASLYQALNFKAGDTLRLKVLEVLPGNRVMVDFGKFQTAAEIKFPVSAGDELLVKVVKADQMLHLNLIGADASKNQAKLYDAMPLKLFSDSTIHKFQTDFLASAETLTKNTNIPRNVLVALAGAVSYFENLSPDVNRAVAQLRGIIENSGVFFENRLGAEIEELVQAKPELSTKELASSPQIRQIINNDLKAHFLALRNFFDNQANDLQQLNSRQLTGINKFIDTILTDISTQQDRAAEQHDTSEQYQVMQFTLPLKDGRLQAKLKVYLPKKKSKGQSDPFKLSLLLNMDRLGEIRTDFSLLEKDLTLTFFVANPDSQLVLNQHRENIRQTLKAGFVNVTVSVVISEEKIACFEDEDVKQIGDKLIDVRI